MEVGAAYIRVSTTDQLEYSPDAQKKAILKYAKDNDIILSNENIFIDEGISGRVAEKRPAFMEMIKRSKSKDCPWSVILVHKFDRFARSREDSIVYKSLLKKEHGIRVASISEQIDSNDKTSVILEAFLEAMAEYYSLNLSEEVRKGMSEKATRGEWNGKAPYGYRLVGKKLEIYEDEAKIVREVFDMYLNQNIPLRAITTMLNNMGLRTRQGKTFETRSIRYMLRNISYIGTAHWNPNAKLDVRVNKNYDLKSSQAILVEDSHPAIIDKETFEKVQIRINRYQKCEKQTYVKHWCYGVLKCSSCGASLTTSKDGFQCINYSHAKCNTSHYLSKIIFEKIFFEALDELITSKKHFNYKIVSSNNDSVKEIYKKQLSTLADKEKRIKEAYLAGIDSIEEYKEYKAKLDEERKSIENNISAMELKENNITLEDMRNRIKDVYDMLKSNNSTYEEKNNALRSICEKIIYNVKDRNIEIFFKCEL